eukprot:SAG22_NODE_17510_length_303_cov_1.235294_1_plen_72_part_10
MNSKRFKVSRAYFGEVFNSIWCPYDHMKLELKDCFSSFVFFIVYCVGMSPTASRNATSSATCMRRARSTELS